MTNQKIRLYDYILFKPGLKVHWCNFRPHYLHDMEKNALGIEHIIEEYIGPKRFFKGPISSLPDPKTSEIEHFFGNNNKIEYKGMQSNYSFIFDSNEEVIVFESHDPKTMYGWTVFKEPLIGRVIKKEENKLVSCLGIVYSVLVQDQIFSVPAKCMIPFLLKEEILNQSKPEIELLEEVRFF